MTPALERRLLDRHPSMLRKLPIPPSRECFEHGDGWFAIVGRLLELLEPYDVVIEQVKQKHGKLRVYLAKYPADTFGIVSDAERRSGWTCERCGFPDMSGLSGGCQGCSP